MSKFGVVSGGGRSALRWGGFTGWFLGGSFSWGVEFVGLESCCLGEGTGSGRVTAVADESTFVLGTSCYTGLPKGAFPVGI